MLMVPLPFVLGLILAGLMLREIETPVAGTRSWPLVAALAVLAVQTVLVGLRFGYGVEAAVRLQPFTAAAFPVLALAGVAFPRNRGRIATALAVAMAITMGALMIGVRWLDPALALLALICAALLAMAAIRAEEALGWVPVSRLPRMRRLAVGVALLLAAIGVIDVAIALDARLGGGQGIPRIVTLATILFLTGPLIVLWWARRPRRTPDAGQDDAGAAGHHAMLVARARAKLLENRRFADPDLTLQRLARRLHVPARDLSRAVNAATGENLSQFINGLRIDEACRLLLDPDNSVTEVQFRSGFHTKSNFNREFRRRTGQSPSAWRKSQNG